MCVCVFESENWILTLTFICSRWDREKEREGETERERESVCCALMLLFVHEDQWRTIQKLNFMKLSTFIDIGNTPQPKTALAMQTGAILSISIRRLSCFTIVHSIWSFQLNGLILWNDKHSMLILYVGKQILFWPVLHAEHDGKTVSRWSGVS